jgi:hypothetical protein
LSGGDLVRAALSVAQMLMLGRQMLGITYHALQAWPDGGQDDLKRAARRSANEGV